MIIEINRLFTKIINRITISGIYLLLLIIKFIEDFLALAMSISVFFF